jgi:hypothetical protein
VQSDYRRDGFGSGRAAVSETGSGLTPPDEPFALSEAEKEALIALLKRTNDEARFPYAPQLAPLKAILAKLVPPAPRPASRPPPRAGLRAGPSHGRGRRR